MNRLMNELSPSVTSMIRMDHGHVLATFHQYHVGTPEGKKQALVNTVCLALEIHTQLEEEIFYPAMRELAHDLTMIDKSFAAHGEMHRLVATLRGMHAGDPNYDETFMELMREVLHHIADEETTLLPAAERLLPDRLGEMGARMTRRRLRLLAPRSADLAWNGLRSLPQSAVVAAAGAMAAGAYLLGRSSR